MTTKYYGDGRFKAVYLPECGTPDWSAPKRVAITDLKKPQPPSVMVGRARWDEILHDDLGTPEFTCRVLLGYEAS